MKFVSVLSKTHYAKKLEIQFWPEDDDYEYDVATIWLIKESHKPRLTFIELSGATVHRFCECESGASKCQFSPTGYCRPYDLLPGSQSEWANKWNDLRTYWKCTPSEQFLNVITVACVNIEWLGVDGKRELLKNLNELARED